MKMFPLKLLKINLKIVPEIVVFSVCGRILIELMYYVLVEDVKVSYLRVYDVVKEDF